MTTEWDNEDATRSLSSFAHVVADILSAGTERRDVVAPSNSSVEHGSMVVSRRLSLIPSTNKNNNNNNNNSNSNSSNSSKKKKNRDESLYSRRGYEKLLIDQHGFINRIKEHHKMGHELIVRSKIQNQILKF